MGGNTILIVCIDKVPKALELWLMCRLTVKPSRLEGSFQPKHVVYTKHNLMNTFSLTLLQYVLFRKWDSVVT